MRNKILFLSVGLFIFLAGMFFQQLVDNKYLDLPYKLILRLEKKDQSLSQSDKLIDVSSISQQVIPASGYSFKIRWGDLGKRLVDDGVIDKVKLSQAINGTNSLPPDLEKYLSETNISQIELNQSSAHFWLDVLWGLGLANKNEILSSGPMLENTANFASTAGWTISTKDPMDLYNKFSYISLKPEQQGLVYEIASSIYRPCCGNSTAFPDCNHGMAALGLIELMVSQGFSKEEIYKTVLAFNSFWFPQTYTDIAIYFAKNKRDYAKIPPSEILSKTFSSAMGYAAIKKQIQDQQPPKNESSGGCGV